MMTSLELTALLSRMAGHAGEILQTQGYLFPYLYVLKRGTPMGFTLQHPTVVGVDAEESGGLSENGHIYRCVIGMKMADKSDDDAIPVIARGIVLRQDPDAVALFMSCAYNEYRRGDIDKVLKELGSVHRDPDAIALVHVCAWTRESDSAIMTNLVYLRRPGAEAVGEENSRCHNSVLVSYPWTRPLQKIGPKIHSPYRALCSAEQEQAARAMVFGEKENDYA